MSAETTAEWTADVLKGNGSVRDDGHWHAEHCPGVPAIECACILIENEMADYRMVMRHCAEIYDEASYGRVSKPNTLPSVVVDFMHEGQRRDMDEAIKEATEELQAEIAALRAQAERLAEALHDLSEAARKEPLERAHLTFPLASALTVATTTLSAYEAGHTEAEA